MHTNPQQSAAKEPAFLTRAEAAQYLRISVQTLDSRVKDGLFHPIRLGRRLLFRSAEVHSFGGVQQ